MLSIFETPDVFNMAFEVVKVHRKFAGSISRESSAESSNSACIIPLKYFSLSPTASFLLKGSSNSYTDFAVGCKPNFFSLDKEKLSSKPLAATSVKSLLNSQVKLLLH